MVGVATCARALAVTLLGLGLGLGLIACSQPEPTTPRGETPPTAAGQPPQPIPDAEDTGDTQDRATATAAEARVELELEFHRSRVAPGGGFWALVEVHNPQPAAVDEVEVRVRLLDGDAEQVGETRTALGRPLGPGARAAMAVRVEGVEHEDLAWAATGVARAELQVEPPAVKLEHDLPQRAPLGGWFVLGQIANTGAQTLSGARLEVRGLDAAGHLLGLDWLVLDPIEAGETIPFDLGGLRYEETPASFALEVI